MNRAYYFGLSEIQFETRYIAETMARIKYFNGIQITEWFQLCIHIDVSSANWLILYSFSKILTLQYFYSVLRGLQDLLCSQYEKIRGEGTALSTSSW